MISRAQLRGFGFSDQAHTAAGRTQLRFANVQIGEAPTAVARTLGAVIGRLAEQR